MSPSADDEDETPADSDTEPERPASAGRRRLLVPSLLGAVAVLAVIAAVVQTTRVSTRNADEEERAEVAATAGALAEAILSYDYTDIEGSLDRVQQYVAGEFAEIYDETFRTVQVPVITELEAIATAEVQLVYVTEIDDGAASAIVLVDQSVQSTAGLRSLTGTYLQMDLVEHDGRWVVEVIPLRISSRNETLTPGGGDPTTPTSSVTPTTTPTTPTTPTTATP